MKIQKIFLAFVMLMFANTLMAQKLDKLILAGPKAPVTPPLAYIVEKGLLNDVAEEVELRIWKNPDQLKSLIISGQAHFTASATQIAAKLYNKGIPLKFMNMSVWGDYWILSNDKSVRTLKDLKGQEIVVPFKSGTPSTVLKLLAKKMDMDLEKDFKVKYMPNFGAALQEIASGRAAHGFLSEPHASMAVIKTKDKANKVYKAVDLSKEWGKLFNTEPRISRAGMVALPKIFDRPDIMEKFQKAYEEAVNWCNANPKKAGKLAQKYIPGFKAKAVTMSLKTGTVEFVSAKDAKADMERFFNALLSQNPKTIGKKLPDNNFYYAK